MREFRWPIILSTHITILMARLSWRFDTPTAFLYVCKNECRNARPQQQFSICCSGVLDISKTSLKRTDPIRSDRVSKQGFLKPCETHTNSIPLSSKDKYNRAQMHRFTMETRETQFPNLHQKRLRATPNLQVKGQLKRKSTQPLSKQREKVWQHHYWVSKCTKTKKSRYSTGTTILQIVKTALIAMLCVPSTVTVVKSAQHLCVYLDIICCTFNDGFYGL